ncbi:MAG: bifunctional nuclease family protein [Ignavibacteriaceae bacterium]|nr:bifunctional nuclease family protein [Ignavibacteriaceae bacterium]
MHKVECEIIGISANPTGGVHALLLKEVFGLRRFPILIGQFEATAIATELEGNKPPRPLTHDLIKNIIENLGATILHVEITDLINNTYHAKIVLDLSSLTNEIDSRPSDAIALALRAQVPIYVNEDILNQVGFVPINEQNANEEFSDEEIDKVSEPLKTKEAKLSAIQNQLREAIEAEEYERAAKLRDELNRLQGNN